MLEAAKIFICTHLFNMYQNSYLFFFERNLDLFVSEGRNQHRLLKRSEVFVIGLRRNCRLSSQSMQ